MFKVKILTIEKQTVIDGNYTQLAAQYQVSRPAYDGDEDEIIGIYSIGFPLDTPPDEVEAAIRAQADVMEQADLSKVENAATDAEHEQADATISALSGKEL